MSAWKIAAAFVVGAGAGVLGSMKFFETKYQKIADEEIQSVIDLYEERLELERKIADTDAKIAEVEAEIASYQEEAEEIEEEKIFVASEEIRRIAESDHPRDDEPEDPFRINEDTYSETELGFDKILLHYYMDDDILFNVNEGQVELGQTIGDEGMNILRQSADTELYFRNYTYGCDYEIIKIAGSYYIDME